MPPEASKIGANTLIDSEFKSELAREHAQESSTIARKQRLLAAEIAKVHDIVASRRASFLSGPLDGAALGGLVRGADYTLNVHPPAETASEIAGGMNSLLKVENARAAAANASDLSEKQALLKAELRAIRSIVHGA